MTDRVRQFRSLYLDMRIQRQRHFYERRARDYESAHRQAVVLRSALLALAMVLGIVAQFVSGMSRGVLGVVAAFLATLAGAVTAFEALIGFGSLSRLYRDTALNLAESEIDWNGSMEAGGTSRRRCGGWNRCFASRTPSGVNLSSTNIREHRFLVSTGARVAASAVLISGHLVDTADRRVPRFPPDQVGRVTAQIRDTFDEWHVGRDTSVFTGGARGADILAAEEAVGRGARLVLCLALPAAEFERRSVELPGTDWAMRFRRLLGLADIETLDQPGSTDRGNVYVRANTWMICQARRIDVRPHAIVVWDGRRGDGPGGTADFVRQLGYHADDVRLRVIDPTPARVTANNRVGNDPPTVLGNAAP
jgi:hypothetical protein